MKSQRYRPFLLMLLSAGSMTIGAKISFDLGEIPLTMQTFFLCLTALYFKPGEAFFGQLIYLVTGLFAPVFSGPYFGQDVLLGTSSGYLLAFPVAAFILARYGKGSDLFGTVSWCVIAHAVILICGFLVLRLVHGLDQDTALNDGLLNLLPGALLKSLLAALIYWSGEKFYRKRKNENSTL